MKLSTSKSIFTLLLVITAIVAYPSDSDASIIPETEDSPAKITTDFDSTKEQPLEELMEAQSKANIVPETKFPAESASRSTFSIVAHRVNSKASMRTLMHDKRINVVEMDVAYVPHSGKGHATWYACHADINCLHIAGKDKAEVLINMLPDHINTIWFDMKQATGVKFNEANFQVLVDICLRHKRIKENKMNVMFGNGDFNFNNFMSKGLDYKQMVMMAKAIHKARHTHNWVLDFWITKATQLNPVNYMCRTLKVYCTVAAGLSMVGQLPGQTSHYLEILAQTKSYSNLIKATLWTLPAGSQHVLDTTAVDDLIRLSAGCKNEWEYLHGHDWACGAHVDMFIVGPWYGVFQGCGATCNYIKQQMNKRKRYLGGLKDFMKKDRDTCKACKHCKYLDTVAKKHGAPNGCFKPTASCKNPHWVPNAIPKGHCCCLSDFGCFGYRSCKYCMGNHAWQWPHKCITSRTCW